MKETLTEDKPEEIFNRMKREGYNCIARGFASASEYGELNVQVFSKSLLGFRRKVVYGRPPAKFTNPDTGLRVHASDFIREYSELEVLFGKPEKDLERDKVRLYQI